MAVSPHVKHIIWAVAFAVSVIGGLAIRGKFEERKAQIEADRDKAIAANQVTSKNAQQAVGTIDAQTKAQIANLQAQIASKPSSAELRAILATSLPGAGAVQATTDARGNAVLAMADTQANRDAINKAVIDHQICLTGLDGCNKEKAKLEEALAADQSTIELQQKDIKDLSKNQVPRWTLMAGVGKTQGTSFRDANNYQPVMGLDYRLSNRFGIFGLAQNKSAAAGISWRFGGTR